MQAKPVRPHIFTSGCFNAGALSRAPRPTPRRRRRFHRRKPTRSFPMFRQALLVTACAGAALTLFACGGSDDPTATPVSSQDALQTATPIKHLVVIYGENVSFDHYFGTYPNATNPAGEPAFTAK